MGAPRVKPAEILEMQRLYTIHATYTAVADIVGRSPSTVAKYVKMEGIPNNIRLAVQELSRKQENEK